MRIPGDLKETIRRVHGAAGERWLEELPALVDEWRSLHGLELQEPFPNLSYNLVIPGRTLDGTEVVLKLGVPCAELSTEAAALSLFRGDVSVRLLGQDAARGVLLLERIIPGTPLHELQSGAEATRTAAQVMRRLWSAPRTGHSFPHIVEWFRVAERLRRRFGGGPGPLPAELVWKAEQEFADLPSTTEASALLHGDLHHDNIVFSAQRGWVAIDPKGVIGDRGYEVGSFMLNRLPAGASDSEIAEVFRERIATFADELGMDEKRLARWAFCHAVLSALWSVEDGDEWQGTVRLAQLLERAG
jgi:streptomycin 6-kinase